MTNDRIQTRWMLITVMWLLFRFGVYAQSELLSSQQQYKEKFELASDLLTLRKTRLLENYSQRLERLYFEAQQTGNLDFVAEVDAEKARVEKGDLSPGLETTYEALAEVRAILLQEEEKIQLEWGRTVLNLTRQYDAYLEKLEQAKVREGTIEEAKVIREYRGRLFEGHQLRKAQKLVSSSVQTEQGHDLIPASRLFPKMPKEAVKFGQSYYVAFQEPKSWIEAKAACEALWGKLVSIESGEEQEFVSGLVKPLGQDRVHIGASDRKEEGKWFWETGKPLEYTNWGSNQPDNANQSEHVAVMFRGSQWLDVSPKFKAPYVCEWGP